MRVCLRRAALLGVDELPCAELSPLELAFLEEARVGLLQEHVLLLQHLPAALLVGLPRCDRGPLARLPGGMGGGELCERGCAGLLVGGVVGWVEGLAHCSC